MKSLALFLFILMQTWFCHAQDEFSDFSKRFPIIKMPIKDILGLSSMDTLNGKQTNDILIRKQKKKPQYVDKNGNLNVIKQYYGLYPEVPFDYGYRGKQQKYFSKIIPMGRIDLQKGYVTLLIKVIAYETTFYDLWNFDKDGNALSVICLFWGMRDAGPRNEKVTYVIVDSKISKEGNILWHENNHGLETFRTYSLSAKGYFHVINEEQIGKQEF